MEFSPQGGNGMARTSSDAVRRVCSCQPRVRFSLRAARETPPMNNIDMIPQKCPSFKTKLLIWHDKITTFVTCFVMCAKESSYETAEKSSIAAFSGRLLHAAPQLPADSGRFDAHSAQSVFCHAHVAAEKTYHTAFASADVKLCETYVYHIVIIKSRC